MPKMIGQVFAQTTAPAGPQGPGQTGGFGGMMIVVYALFIGGFYFLFIAPQKKKQKEHEKLLATLQSGDEVVTTGGILGRIIEVNDTFVTLEIADGVRIKVQKSQITQLMPKGTLKSA